MRAFGGRSVRADAELHASRGDFALPRYDYRCTICGHQFELRQSFDSATVAECAECGAPSNRKIHAPPVIFKGSGWYVTDYGKGRGNNGMGPDKAESKSDRGEKVSGDGSSSESGASKPATAAAGKDD